MSRGKSTPVRVGLLWHSADSGNLGVGALTLANMDLVRQAAAMVGVAPEFTIICMRDSGPSYVSPDQAGIFTVDTRTLLSPSGCLRVIGAQDCILDIGGGDSFAEIYGAKRFMFLWLSKMMAISRRVPLMLSPQTIGPFTRAPYRQLARYALEKAEVVLARDDVSLEALQDLAPRARARLSVDVAFALPYESQEKQRRGPRVRVGVNVSGLLFNDALSGVNRFGLQIDYAELMRRFLADLASDPGVEIHLISHVASAGDGADNDGPVAERLAKEFPTAILVAPFEGPSRAKSYISGMDFLFSGRMHACIAAFSSGVPVVPVAYSRKFSGLFGMLEYSWQVPVKGLDTDGALAYLHEGLKRRDLLAKDVQRGMSRVGALLDVYRSTLTHFLTDVAARV